MICAYDRVYLESARRNLARMLDFAVYDMCYDLQQFYHLVFDVGNSRAVWKR